MTTKDQTFCPKCRRMYCEGYWGEGVCIADMFFGDEPTAAGDATAEYLRVWYEANRPSWWQRRRDARRRTFGCADEFMLALLNEVARITGEAERQELNEPRPAGSGSGTTKT